MEWKPPGFCLIWVTLDIPIVAVTVNALLGDCEKCLASGMNDYVSKPIRRDIVFEVLKKWVIEP